MSVFRHALCAAALLSLCATGFAQHEARASCSDAGPNALEPLDREGRLLQVNQYSCRISGGPFDGSVMTGTNVWEFDQGKARFLSGHGVIRRPDLTAVFEHSEGALVLKMNGGHVVGWESTGAGVYKMASGRVSPFAGRRYSFFARPTGPGSFGSDLLIAEE